VIIIIFFLLKTMPNHSPSIHFARQVSYDNLINQLEIEKAQNNVYETNWGDLALYCYTKHCVYNLNWNQWNTQARGLILDKRNQEIVATPFPKFFNYGERQIALPDEPFEAFDKLDGSLIICYYYQDNWQTATKGDLQSIQAQKARKLLSKSSTIYLEEGTTYLFEYIAPDNQIVIKYPDEQLVLLGAYNREGKEFLFSQLEDLAAKLGFLIPQRFAYSSINDIMKTAQTLDKNNEGFVIRFENGLRLKIKGFEYGRIHKLITGITPLTLWELMREQSDLSLIRQEIPEEYWDDFDAIEQQLTQQLNNLIEMVENAYINYQNLSDKELGLLLNSLTPIPKAYLFQRRKKGENWYKIPKTRASLFNQFRPINNQLEDYE
jgi:RNA ligase